MSSHVNAVLVMLGACCHADSCCLLDVGHPAVRYAYYITLQTLATLLAFHSTVLSCLHVDSSNIFFNNRT